MPKKQRKLRAKKEETLEVSAKVPEPAAKVPEPPAKVPEPQAEAMPQEQRQAKRDKPSKVIKVILSTCVYTVYNTKYVLLV